MCLILRHILYSTKVELEGVVLGFAAFTKRSD